MGKLFLKGLAVVIPVALTLAILWWVAAGAERWMGAILKYTLPDGWYLPGMGLVSGLALIALIGLLSHVLVFQKIFNLGEAIFHRLPLVPLAAEDADDHADAGDHGEHRRREQQEEGAARQRRGRRRARVFSACRWPPCWGLCRRRRPG